jgi:dUTP pyrophosphatase
MTIKVINKSKHDLPKYQTELSAGMDLYANIDEPITLKPLERTLVKTGLFISLPKGYEAQMRPRSGLSKTELRFSTLLEQLMQIIVVRLG